jgi:hypothetical protein
MFQFITQKQRNNTMEAETIKNAASVKSHTSKINFITINFVMFILTCILFVGCEKPEEEIIPDLFEIPITNWQLTKNQVLETESHLLTQNISASEIVFLAYPFTEKGDGALKYSGGNFLDEINYGFYNANKTLEVVICIYTKTNVRTTDKTLEFLNSKYGEYTTKTKQPNYSGFVGNVYEFKASFGVVVLEEYSSSTNRVLFSKSQYTGKLGL